MPGYTAPTLHRGEEANGVLLWLSAVHVLLGPSHGSIFLGYFCVCFVWQTPYPPGWGESKATTQLCIPQTGLQCWGPLMNVIFPRRKSCLMCGGWTSVVHLPSCLPQLGDVCLSEASERGRVLRVL